MPMLESSVAITTSQHPSSAALPAKQLPEAIPTSGTSPLRRANRLKARQSSPATIGMSTSPGRPAAALGEQHHRQPAALGELEQAVLLLVAAHALGARQHRVVVGHRHAAHPIHLADSRDQAVGGRAGDQLLARATALLGGEQQRPVLDEAAPGRASSARFSRAVRRPRSRRLATASGRAASSPTAWRSRTARRSARSRRPGLRGLRVIGRLHGIRLGAMVPLRDHRSGQRRVGRPSRRSRHRISVGAE